MVLSDVLSHVMVLSAAGVQPVDSDACARGADKEVAHIALSSRVVYIMAHVLVFGNSKRLRIRICVFVRT